MEAVDEVLGVDELRRSMLAEVNELKAQRNEVSKKIGELKREGADAAANNAHLLQRLDHVQKPPSTPTPPAM